MKRLIFALALLLSFSLLSNAQTNAQQGVKQTGHVTYGHPTMWTTNGIVQDAGPAVMGFLTGIGVVAQGPGICQVSGPQSGPYQQLCLSVQPNSPAQITLQNFGGAPPQQLQFVVNGTVIGAATTVSNLDGTLTIAPTTGAIIASLNTSHANTWTAIQTFSSGFTLGGKTATAISGNTNTLLSLAGSVINGGCANGDSNGNIVFGSGACVSSGSGVTAGTIGQAAFYASTGSVVSGTNNLSAVGFISTGSTTLRTFASRGNDSGANILDFGADPTGSADSTAAIQAAIDSVAGTNARTIFCPDGQYKTTLPIFLDAPGNLRGADGTHGQTWLSGGGYSLGETVNSSGVAYIALSSTSGTTPPGSDPTHWRVFAWSGATTYSLNAIVSSGGIPWISLQNSNTNNTPAIGSAFWRPYFVFLSANSTNANFGLSFKGNWALPGNQGCNLKPTFDNSTFFWVGPGNGNSVQGLSLVGTNPNNYYRGQYPSTGVGLCIVSSNGGGANRTRIENVQVNNINTAFATACNNGPGIATVGQLGAENSWRRVVGANCATFLNIEQSQNFANDVDESEESCTTGFVSNVGTGLHVSNSNTSVEFGATNTYTIGSTSASTTSGGTGSFVYTFTTTISFPVSSDICGSSPGCLACAAYGTTVANCVYNAWTLLTAHYGPVPLQITNFNFSTHVATFQTTPQWSTAFFGRSTDAVANTDLSAEIQAATQIFASEKALMFWGMGFQADHLHVEQGVCTTFYLGSTGFGGDSGNIFDHIFFNYQIGFSSSSTPGNQNYPQFICQSSFPFIDLSTNGGGGGAKLVTIKNSTYGSTPAGTVNIDLDSGGPRCIFQGIDYTVNGLTNPSLRINGSYGFFNYTVGCEWDTTPFYITGGSIQTEFDGIPQQGWGPASYIHPKITNQQLTIWQSVSGNSLNNYAIPFGGWLYDVTDNNAPAAPTKSVQSVHSYYSYGQDLNTTTVGAGLSWAYKGQSCAVLIDSTTMGFLFPGLGIYLDNGGGPHNYLITGIYPNISLDGGTHTGYFTIRDAAIAANPACGQGTKTTVYTCPGNCPSTKIGQDPYVLNLVDNGTGSIFTSATTAISGMNVLADTHFGPWTLTLPPNPQTGQTVSISDAQGTWASNNLTVNGNGANINSSGSNLVLNTNGQAIRLNYINSTIGWKQFTL